MKTTLIILMTLLLTTGGCTKEERESKHNNRCNFVLIDSEQYNNLTTDDFNIVDIKFEDRCLKITIRYGGGCKDVSLRLIDSDSVFGSNPVQRNLKILGIFVRLFKRDNKDNYLRFLPYTWLLIEKRLENPAFKNLKILFYKYLPIKKLIKLSKI